MAEDSGEDRAGTSAGQSRWRTAFRRFQVLMSCMRRHPQRLPPPSSGWAWPTRL